MSMPEMAAVVTALAAHNAEKFVMLQWCWWHTSSAMIRSCSGSFLFAGAVGFSEEGERAVLGGCEAEGHGHVHMVSEWYHATLLRGGIIADNANFT